MSLRICRIQTLTVELDAKPGSLASVLRAFHEAKVELVANWAYEMGPNQAQAHFYPCDLNHAKSVLLKMGKKPKIEWACYAEGEDRLGIYLDVLQKAASADVNISASDAISTGSRFAACFFCDEKQYPKFCEAVGC